VAGPLDFWKLVKEVNPKHIREEAARELGVAAVGSVEEIAALARLAGMDADGAREAAGDRWVEAVLPLTPEMRRRVAACSFALAVSPDDARETPIVTWALPEDPERRKRDVAEILDRFPHLAIALPRAIPMFRAEATDRVIAASAKTNTELALVTALPGILPWTAVLLPAMAFPDMVLLTKNQAMMVLRIAAIYGREVDPKARLGELGSVIGAAFGWRALAREIVGAVPGGVGAAAKGAIAYAGTVATGRAAQAFYTTGRTPTDAQQRAWYEEALEKGRAAAREARERMRRKEPEPEPA